MLDLAGHRWSGRWDNEKGGMRRDVETWEDRPVEGGIGARLLPGEAKGRGAGEGINVYHYVRF